MIDEIHVKNIALILDADLCPAKGMTAITGETGAGKTALLASCKLLMGQRADRSYVREGEEEAEVQGRLFLPESLMIDNGLNPDARREEDIVQPSLIPAEREVVATRRLTADGRSHVKINGEMASVAQLADLISPSIDLCSQHDHQMLTMPSEQRRFLDAWCENDINGLLETYRDAYDAVQEARLALDKIKNANAASDAKIEDARYILKQIDAVDPSQEDYDALIETLRRSQSAEMLARVTSEAHSALADEGNALDALSGAVALIEDGAKADSSLSKQADLLRDALFTVEDVARELAAYGSAIDLDVSELEMMQERASSYQSLMRLYGPQISVVIAKADEARATIALADNADEVEAKAVAALEEATSKLADAAKALTSSRKKGAPELSSQITQVMSQLEMGSAAFACTVESLPEDRWTLDGADDVVFEFQPSSGMQFRPLAKIASGGELSRVMLAVHVVMGERDSVPTLVFDEIDAGVGGATALALGDVLARLARTHQVIVVTHLAQVAAKADCQYVVRKTNEGDPPRTVIEQVIGDAREQEIARMLSGSITQASLEHARELLVN